MAKTHYVKNLKDTVAGQAKKIQEMSLENEGLLYTRDDLEKKVRALEYALKHTTDDRNRYAKLYDGAGATVIHQERELAKMSRAKDKFEAIAWPFMIVFGGATVFLGTIVACIVARL